MCSRSCGVVERPLSALCTVQWLDPSRARYFKNLYSWFMAQRSGWYLSASWVQSVWSLESFHSGPFGIMLVYYMLVDSHVHGNSLIPSKQHTFVWNAFPKLKGKKRRKAYWNPLFTKAYSLARNRHLAKPQCGTCLRQIAPSMDLLMLLRPMLSNKGRGASVGSLKWYVEGWSVQNSFYQWYP
jgi:hypothetical protein